MAIYRLSASVISRSSGRTATAASAYRAGACIEDQRSGTVFDYTRKSAVEYAEILAPAGTPEWMRDRSALWNAVEAAERRKDAQLAREIQLALPRELTAEQRVELVRAFVQTAFVDRGMVADVAIHNPACRDGAEQPHAHVMLTMRALTADGFGPKERSWNSDELLCAWRADWAAHANRFLEQAGSDQRIDHRSLAAQRADYAQQAASRQPGQERLSLESKAAEFDRDPTPSSRRAYHIEERARERAANDNRAYRPVTDRGVWLAAFREQLAERVEALRQLTQVLRERMEQLLMRVNEHLVGKRRQASEPARQEAFERVAPLSAADRLRQAEAVAQANQTPPAAQAMSAAERLRQAEEIAQRGRDLAKETGQTARQNGSSQRGQRDQGQE